MVSGIYVSILLDELVWIMHRPEIVVADAKNVMKNMEWGKGLDLMATNLRNVFITRETQ